MRRPPSPTGTRNRRGVSRMPQPSVINPSGTERNDSAASRPSRIRWMYRASGRSRSRTSEVLHVERRLVAPASLVAVGGVGGEHRGDRLPCRHPGAEARLHRCGRDAPLDERREPPQVVDECRGVDRRPVPPRELGDEERLVGDRGELPGCGRASRGAASSRSAGRRARSRAGRFPASAQSRVRNTFRNEAKRAARGLCRACAPLASLHLRKYCGPRLRRCREPARP